MYAYQKDPVKHVIANRDINDPAEFKEIAPVELDLDWKPQPPAPVQPDYSAAIAEAAAAQEVADREQQQREKMRLAQAEFEAGQKELADKIAAKSGFAVGYSKGWVYKPKPKVAYGLWRRVLLMFIERPETLAMKPKALVELLAPNEPNFTIKRDMLYDKLNRFAVADLKRLLQAHAITLTPVEPVTIRSMQKQLKERHDARCDDATVEKLSGKFEIRGDTAIVNGTAYTIQKGASGKPRIKRDGEWLSLDALRVFCRRTG